MRRGLSSDSFVRLVGGDIKSSVVTTAPNIRMETIRRVANGPWHWHFRQPELCLCWFESGTERLSAFVDGRPVTREFSTRSQLCIIPPRTEVEGEWNAASQTSYTIVFLNSDFAEAKLKDKISEPVFAFEHPTLVSSLVELSREAARPGNTFNLLAEGWSIQALAYMARVVQGEEAHARRIAGGLSNRNTRIASEYISAHLGEEITLQCLADQVGLSKRHFQRAFQETFGVTPYRYIIRQRVAEAKLQLSMTKNSITEVALTNGFYQVEHFAHTFKRFTGLTPSQYREQST